MKTIIKSILTIWLLGLMSACSEEVLKPLNDGDGSTPPKVSNIKVENLSGAVRVSYDMPKGVSLLYVEAEVDMGNGRVAKSSSSYYNHYLEIEGFGEAKEYEVQLYSVGRNLTRSESTRIKVNPLEPPVTSIFNSLEVVEDFGGMSISFENPTQAEVSVVVEMENADGEWNTVETFYTKLPTGVLTVRGLESVPSVFRIYVNDRWENRSPVLQTELTPIFEEELDYTKFVAMKLLNDPNDFGTRTKPALWNGNLGNGWYRTDNGTPLPTQVTIDMGQTAKLSRFKFWQRGSQDAENDLLYAGGSPRQMEIWGSNYPSPDGSYDSWERLIEITMVKPSGLPLGNNSPEDVEVAGRGHEFTFPLDAPAFRYLRIRVLSTFGVTEYFWMSEIELYGEVQE